MPFGYEVFPGDWVDLSTVPQVVATMDNHYRAAQRV
jgi:hypothetical protein